MRRPLACALLAMLSIEHVSYAQPRAPGRAQPARPPPVQPQNPLAAQSAELPPPPEVSDPMLTPVPRARLEIGTWDEALKYIRARSTDLHIAIQEVARAEGQSRVALAGVLPSFNGTGTYTHNIITNTTAQFSGFTAAGVPTTRPVDTPYPNYFQGSIVGVQPFIALRAWNAIGTAGVAVDAAKLTVDETKRQIALGVANAIVAVVTSERIAELNRVGLRNALQRLDLTTRKQSLGGATGIDVVRARQDVEDARATLVAGDETLRQNRENLGLALGIPEQVGVPPTVDISGLERDARSICKPVDRIDERPDVATLLTRVRIARRNVDDVWFQFAPTVNLQSQVATTTVDTGAAPNTTWNVQAVLSVPIWDGGARYGNLRDTRAQELQAHERVEAQRRQAQIDIDRARRGVGVADDRRRVASAARDLAAENDRLTRVSYQEGRGTSLELVTTAQALREAEIQLALREFETVNARIVAVLALAKCPW